MNDRQRRFVEAYVALGNATRAAKEAGYSEDTAYAQGHRLLKDAEIRAAIDERQANLANELGLTRQWVLEQLRRSADLAMEGSSRFDKDGNEVGVDRNLSAANKALELIGKAHAMWVDRAQVETSGMVEYTLSLGGASVEDVDDDPEG